ncbi:MAG: hypothetical protein V1835_05490 [Candidatus Micrarchaeota archaeon]
MVQLQKGLVYGAMVWFAIAIIGSALNYAGSGLKLFQEVDVQLLMIPISAIIILIFAVEYLRQIHAQYEAEGLELAVLWFGVSVFLEALIVAFLYGKGIGHFLSIATWLGIAFKFVFPLAAGMYLQHTLTE